MKLEELPQLISLLKVSRQLRIPYRWIRDAALKCDKINLYVVPGTPGQGLMFDITELDRVLDCVLVRVNEPDNPLPPIEPTVINNYFKDDEKK